MPRRRLLTVLLTLSALTAGTAFAASIGVSSGKLTGWQSASTVPCNAATVTASADADSWVDGSSTGSNFGTATSLTVRSVVLLGNRRALVRFALPTLPYACTVTAATLRLNATSASLLGRTLQALRVSSTWTEDGVTWANQPSTTGTAATTASGTGYRTWSVTSQVAAMYAGSNFGFLIRDATEGAVVAAEQQFNSREAGSNNPELVITFG